MNSLERTNIIYDSNSLLIQSDWNKLKVNEQFYIGFRKLGEESDYINVIKKEGIIESGLKNTTIRNVSERKLYVNYNGIETTFIAPSVELYYANSAESLQLNSFDEQQKSNCVTSIDFSPNQNLIVCGDKDGVIRLWNSRTGENKHKLQRHIFDVNKCRFLPSDNHFLSCGLDMTIRVWTTFDTGRELESNLLTGHTRAVTDLAISSKVDSLKFLSTSKDMSIKKWDISNNKSLDTWFTDSEVLSVSTNKEFTLFACGLRNGFVKIYGIEDTQKIAEFKVGSSCTSLYFDDGIYYCGTRDGEIHCINLTNLKIVSILRTFNGSVTRISKISALGLIVSYDYGNVSIFSDPLKSALTHIEFTGPDISPIYDFTHTDDILFSAAQDGIIRKYHLKFCNNADAISQQQKLEEDLQQLEI